MSDERYNDYPLDTIAASMGKAIQRGATTYFKWTCTGCGERVTANNPDTITKLSKHEEKEDGSLCGHVTNTEMTGGNFLFIEMIGRS